jgi:hypothetical protein
LTCKEGSSKSGDEDKDNDHTVDNESIAEIVDMKDEEYELENPMYMPGKKEEKDEKEEE